MHRIVALAACLASFCFAASSDAQQAGAPRHIGVLLVAWSLESKMAQAFRDGMREAGYVEGRDVVVEWRTANGHYDRVPQLANDLVERKVEVIVVDATVGTRIDPAARGRSHQMTRHAFLGAIVEAGTMMAACQD